MVLGVRGCTRRVINIAQTRLFSNYRHSFNVTQTTFLFVFRCRFNRSWSPTIRCTFTWLMLCFCWHLAVVSGGGLSGTNSRGRNAPFYVAFFRNVTPAINMYWL